MGSVQLSKMLWYSKRKPNLNQSEEIITNHWDLVEVDMGIELAKHDLQDDGDVCDGANAKFHEDDCLHNEPYISSLDILTEHWEKYFSDNEYTRDEFKGIFIDKFVEGKHIVCYE